MTHHTAIKTPTVPTVQEIEEMWEKDSKIDKTQITECSLETDYLHAKYLKIYRACKEQSTRLKYSLQKASFDAKEYYDGKADAATYKKKPFDRKVMKGDLEKWVSNDPEVAKLSIAHEKTLLKVEMCESILKQISYRSMSIKNAIEYLKFLNGG